MTAVLASYVKMSTLVDGTMRVVLDIEPTAAPEAFAMLGAPGSPIALARITDTAAVAQDRKAQATADKKPLSLASKVALTCKEQSFQKFLVGTRRAGWVRAMETAQASEDLATSRENIAAEVVKAICIVASRSEIVEGSHAALSWQSLEADYHDWQRRAA